MHVLQEVAVDAVHAALEVDVHLARRAVAAAVHVADLAPVDRLLARQAIDQIELAVAVLVLVERRRRDDVAVLVAALERQHEVELAVVVAVLAEHRRRAAAAAGDQPERGEVRVALLRGLDDRDALRGDHRRLRVLDVVVVDVVVLAHPRVDDADLRAGGRREFDRLAPRERVALLLLGHALVRVVDAGDEAVAEAAGVGVDLRGQRVVLRVRLLLRQVRHAVAPVALLLRVDDPPDQAVLAGDRAAVLRLAVELAVLRRRIDDVDERAVVLAHARRRAGALVVVGGVARRAARRVAAAVGVRGDEPRDLREDRRAEREVEVGRRARVVERVVRAERAQDVVDGIRHAGDRAVAADEARARHRLEVGERVAGARRAAPRQPAVARAGVGDRRARRRLGRLDRALRHLERRQALVAGRVRGDQRVLRRRARLEAGAVELRLHAPGRVRSRGVVDDAPVDARVVERVAERARPRVLPRVLRGLPARAPALVAVVGAVDHGALVHHDAAADDVDRLLVAAAAPAAVERRARPAAAAHRGDAQVTRVQEPRVVEVALQLGVEELARALAMEAGLEHLAEVGQRGAVDLRDLVDLAVVVVVDAVREEEPRELGPRQDVRLLQQLLPAEDRLVLEGLLRDVDLIVAAVAVDAAQLVVGVDVPRRQPRMAAHARAVEREVVVDPLLLGRARRERGGPDEEHQDRDRADPAKGRSHGVRAPGSVMNALRAHG